MEWSHSNNNTLEGHRHPLHHERLPLPSLVNKTHQPQLANDKMKYGVYLKLTRIVDSKDTVEHFANGAVVVG